jgi:hypothetical protein
MPKIVFLQRFRELQGRVVAAAIRVENSILGKRMIAGCHLDGLLDQRRFVVIVRRPADHFFCMAVDDRGQVKPALPCRNVGNIADHFHPAQHRRQIEQLQDQIRERAAVQDWDAVLTVNDQLIALDPDAADPDALASTAREQITRRQEAEAAAAIQADLSLSPPETPINKPANDEIPASMLAPPHTPETPPTAPSEPQPMQAAYLGPSVPSPWTAATRPAQAASAPRLGPLKRTLSVLWALLPTLTIGILTPILAPVPFAHAAVRLRDRGLWLIAAAYGFGSLAAWVLWIVAIDEKWNAASFIFYSILLAIGVVATIHAFKLRSRVFTLSSSPTAANSGSPRAVP